MSVVDLAFTSLLCSSLVLVLSFAPFFLLSPPHVFAYLY